MRITYPTVRLSRCAPDRIAAVDADDAITYGELEERIVRDAQRLASCGVRRGDRVAAAAANSLEWVSLVHACVRIGAILAPLNTRLTPSDLRNQLQLLHPVVLIADAGNASRLFVDDLDGSIHTIVLDGKVPGWGTWNDVAAAPCDVPSSVDLDAVCSIIATSGSSGDPKLVALTYGNHYFSSLASAINLGHRETDMWLINLPLYHVGGLSIVHRAAVSGFSVCVQESSRAADILHIIDEQNITHLSVVAALLQRLVADGDRSCPEHVQAVLVGGGAVDQTLMNAARQFRYPVLATYGMTETASQAATQSPRHGTHDADGARPLPMCDIAVRDADGVACAPGEVGRICIRGPMVSPGYWQASGHILSDRDNDWFCTEDVGSMDASGALRVAGRQDDVIVSGGENVSLREIEEVAIQCTGISRVAAVPVDDPQWGQASVLFVEAVAPVDETIVESFLRAHLASFKLPRQIIVLESLPVTALGKIDRAQLTREL